MLTYRCYLLDCRNKIAAVEVIKCEYDVEARRRADALLVDRPTYHGVEVWDGRRRVYVNMVGVEMEEGSADHSQGRPFQHPPVTPTYHSG